MAKKNVFPLLISFQENLFLILKKMALIFTANPPLFPQKQGFPNQFQENLFLMWVYYTSNFW
ncbi:hypothetical protein BK140_18835 [Paenibacillus macerans]|nr:hypothetical protein BK140_18835 [Paenibacillus macerans]